MLQVFQLAWVYERISGDILVVKANFMVPYYPLENPNYTTSLSAPEVKKFVPFGCYEVT